FTVDKGDWDPDAFQLEIIDAGVEECDLEGDAIIITTAMEDFGNVQRKLDEMRAEIINATLQRIPLKTKKLDLETSVKLMKLIEDFEDMDDVQSIYHNLEVTDELLEAMEEE
ncbi:MAG TPA: YebC/PmpR family DNA-binding transcriptional regulator, partial [Bacteroidales bacterium]|nr:YebC/PmpR family DNA-binding transcriptional regulator [Bacteroidales bacterium]